MLEAPLRDLLATQIEVLEQGLILLEKEQYVPAGIGTKSFIDLLAKDRRGRWVIIELKRSDAASRQAIHEIYKYVEAVKRHLGARNDEIRTIIASTEWKELLVPFSNFVHDSSISVSGIEISVDESDNSISSDPVDPLPVNTGRVLSPWHEISLYKSPERLAEGIASYDASCAAKGLQDYVMVELMAPAGFYEASVAATAASIHAIRGGTGEPSKEVIEETASKMDRLDHMIYFVPQLHTADQYLTMIQKDPAQTEEVMEFIHDMEGEELQCTLQEYAMDAAPKIDRDYFEIGNPAKFSDKLLNNEGWHIIKIHRRGTFARNSVLSDDTILCEIKGEAGTSGQRLQRIVVLSDKAEFAQVLNDIATALPNNSVWVGMMRDQLEEARNGFPEGTATVSLFCPSTGLMTLYFAVTQEDGVQAFTPCYTITVVEDDKIKRAYVGEVIPTDKNTKQSPGAFTEIMTKYYDGQIGALTMNMTWGGYEARDIDILDDIGLTYDSFRLDIDGDDRKFFLKKNHRWKEVEEIVPYLRFVRYLDHNEQLLKILVNKLAPRFSGGIWDSSNADMLLKEFIDPATVARGKYYSDPPTECDICSIPFTQETLFSDALVDGASVWANMCADCSYFYGAGIKWGTGQLYLKEPDGRWLLVGGSSKEDEEE